jgi:hypothetical protein
MVSVIPLPLVYHGQDSGVPAMLFFRRSLSTYQDIADSTWSTLLKPFARVLEMTPQRLGILLVGVVGSFVCMVNYQDTVIS